MIPAGESFDDHQVHESAWVTQIDGEVEITRSDGQSVIGSTGPVVAFAPNERHALHARSDARLLLLLTPWPGVDQPGAMTLEQKANARRDAAAQNGPLTRSRSRAAQKHLEPSITGQAV